MLLFRSLHMIAVEKAGAGFQGSCFKSEKSIVSPKAELRRRKRHCDLLHPMFLRNLR